MVEEDYEVDSCIVVRTGKKAILVDIEGQELWMPFSQIDPSSDIGEESISGDSGKLVIPMWLARAKGLA